MVLNVCRITVAVKVETDIIVSVEESLIAVKVETGIIVSVEESLIAVKVETSIIVSVKESPMLRIMHVETYIQTLLFYWKTATSA